MRLPVLDLLLALPVAGQSTSNGKPAAHVSGQKTKDLAELRAKAEQGDEVAQNNLAIRYDRGRGVHQNIAEAYMWLSLAAVTGDEDFLQNRDIVAKKLSHQDIARAQ